MVPELYLKCKSEKSETVSHSDMLNFLRPYGFYPTRLLCPWNSSVKNTAVGCQSLLQGIFPTQGLNPCLLHCRQILYHLSRQESSKSFHIANRISADKIWYKHVWMKLYSFIFERSSQVYLLTSFSILNHLQNEVLSISLKQHLYM